MTHRESTALTQGSQVAADPTARAASGRLIRVILFAITGLCAFVVMGIDGASFGRAAGLVWAPHSASVSLVSYAVLRGAQAVLFNPLNLLLALVLLAYAKATVGRSRRAMGTLIAAIFVLVSIGSAVTAFDRAQTERVVVPRQPTFSEYQHRRELMDKGFKLLGVPNPENQ